MPAVAAVEKETAPETGTVEFATVPEVVADVRGAIELKKEIYKAFIKEAEEKMAFLDVVQDKTEDEIVKTTFDAWQGEEKKGAELAEIMMALDALEPEQNFEPSVGSKLQEFIDSHTENPEKLLDITEFTEFVGKLATISNSTVTQVCSLLLVQAVNGMDTDIMDELMFEEEDDEDEEGDEEKEGAMETDK
eukprot:TRINITY_DN3877_c0_g3_i1.p2 TRINITY_DN3877_c0_g3~~TRINITY_DN3877_c0_g3_i1.p2  ORF type:complete len:191 (-),score=64.82 TRINITY_DN3877_c0_g3_i1:296-868(-)